MSAGIFGTFDTEELGVAQVRAWTTTRDSGSFGFGTTEPIRDVFGRWSAVHAALRVQGVERLASAHQVHGADVATHAGDWRGWLRMDGIDGHMTTTPGTAMAVTVADCTPVFIGHPGGAAAVLHAGWRGTAAGILETGLRQMAALGFDAARATVRLGPSICGHCYEVGPEVLEAVHGTPAHAKGLLDVRAVLMEQATALGVRDIASSSWCTKCDNERFFSHRAGDEGRQIGIVALFPT